MKTRILKLLLICSFILSIFTEPLDINILKEKGTDPKKLKEYIDKIKHGMMIEPTRPISPPVPPLKNIQEKIRKLTGETSLKMPGFIPLSKDTETQKSNLYAYTHVLKNLKRSQSQYLIYPYEFTYAKEGEDPKTFEEGGFFNLKPENMKDSDKFSFIKTDTNVHIGKAKALYDTNIAILKLETKIDDNPVDLFYESDNFCSLIQNTLSKYSTCLYGTNAFLEQQQKKPQSTSIVYIHSEDINIGNILESDDGSNRIGVLFIPDIREGSIDLIYSFFGDLGKTKIQNFYKNGGVIIASGKGAYLLEMWGILETGTFNTKKILKSNADSNKAKLVKTTPNESDDFEKKIMELNLEEDTYLFSTYLINQSKAQQNGLIEVASYDTTGNDIQILDSDSGSTSDLTAADKAYMPAILYKKNPVRVNENDPTGKVIIFNGNPLLTIDHYNGVINSYMLSLCRPVVFDFYVKFAENPDLPIPGGEGGILLSVSVDFINTYENKVSDVELNIFFPNKVNLKSFPNDCVISTEEVNGLSLDPTKFKMENHLKCSIAELNSFETKNIDTSLEIEDASVTQKGTDITLIYPVISYKDEETGVTDFINTGGLKVEAKLGAILRGSINPDPSSTYPFPGKGYPADNDIQIENKENTIADNVVYYGVLPLVSPLVDGVDQTLVSHYLMFYNKYYLDHGANPAATVGNFSVPWKVEPKDSEYANLAQAEYIDYLELSGHNVVLGADWDQPVKINKKSRASYPSIADFPATELDVINAGYSTNIEGTEMLLEQINFLNADLFYEVGTQRLMVYVEIQQEKGFEYFFADSTTEIRNDAEDPHNPGRSKRTLIFSRNDIYFYDNPDYQNPRGITSKHIISVDKYPKPDPAKCDPRFGFKKPEVMEKGYFDHTKIGGFKANEWVNMLFQTCEFIQVDPTAPGFENPSEDFKFIHYLVPCKEDIIYADSIMNFTLDEAGKKSGYLREYPSVRFIWGHGAKISIPGDQSRQGGKLTFTLPANARFENDDNVLEDDLITYSADQVAFYKTTYDKDTKTIVAYFKRGLMPNEAYGQPSEIEIQLEKIILEESFTIDIELEEVKYDVTSKETGYEKYEKREGYKNVEFTYKPYYSFPAVEIANKLDRNGASDMKEYELLAPFTRYGVYQQELLLHRTVYSYLEVHNVKDPGLVAPNGGFATCSNIGISSIPTKEFVTHGGLLIPSAARTSRMEWTDIWGRRWAQPLRSVFPDIPPIPPPLRNFVMRTTFELLTPEGERLLEWPSDEEAYIHVQLKFLNNYPKFFLPITCPQNRYPYVKDKVYTFKNDRVFTPEPDFQYITPEDPRWNKDNYDVSFGFSSVYGECFKTENAMLSGEKLTSEDLKIMDYAMTCSATLDAQKIKECENKLMDSGVKTLSRQPEDDERETNYNYSPYIEDFYPKGYIKRNMWNLQHYDYDDNAMDKAYRYHCGNNLPSLDVCPPQNPAYYKPHNVVTFPLFKGFGYQMTYTQDMTLPNYPSDHQGWWSDQLQNKDNTLLAGQEISNDISVGKETLLPPEKWINVKDLDKTGSSFLTNRLKNIYVCEFNQHRIKVTPSQKIYAFPENVLQNNVVPIHPDLEDEDERLTNFDCTGKYQYSPLNISKVDNIVKTVTDRDWLYFAINLRGGARENIHIAMKLTPFEDRKFEGITKVQDGGRFIYWNPVNGPNSFLMMDNPVNTVEGYRVDLEVDLNIYPNTMQTFNGEIYQVYTVKDPNEELREYKETTYANSYGFGDSTITVYVGGTQDTVCKIKENESTFVKITFYNNCGFDWNLKGDAIDFEFLENKVISANDLLGNKYHSIQKPLKYNFITPEIPEDLVDYIEITPSDHNIETAPQFFDFENINVATIRDGFEGNYYYKITIKKKFPTKYQGRFITIPITLHEEYFDNLPNPNDVTHIHNYTLSIPPIKIAYPYEEGEYAGKVFETYGRAENIMVQSTFHRQLILREAKFLTDDDHEKIKEFSGDTKSGLSKIREYFAGLSNPIDFTFEQKSSSNVANFYFNNTQYSVFPKINEDKPDTTSFKFITRVNAGLMTYGYQKATTNTTVSYRNIKRKKDQTTVIESPEYRSVTVKGAYLTISYSGELVALDADNNYYKLDNQKLYETDPGTVKIGITLENIGSDICYNTDIYILYDSSLNFLSENLKEKYEFTIEDQDEGKILKVQTKYRIGPGEKSKENFYFEFPAAVEVDNLNGGYTRLLQKLESKKFIDRIYTAIDLSPNLGENTVVQYIEMPFTMKYETEEKEYKAISSLENRGSFEEPKFLVTVIVNSKEGLSNDFCYRFFRKIVLPDSENKFVSISNECSDDANFVDEFTFKNLELDITGLETYDIEYKIEIFLKGTTKNSFITSTSIKSKIGKVEPTKKDDKKFPIWIIIVVVVAVLLIAGGIILFLCLRRKKDEKQEEPVKLNNDGSLSVKERTNNERSLQIKEKEVVPIEPGSKEDFNPIIPYELKVCKLNDSN